MIGYMYLNFLIYIKIIIRIDKQASISANNHTGLNMGLTRRKHSVSIVIKLLGYYKIKSTY